MSYEAFVCAGGAYPSYEEFRACAGLYRPASSLLVGYRVEYARYSCFWEGPCASGAGVVVEVDVEGAWAEVLDDCGHRVRVQSGFAARIVDIPAIRQGQRLAYGDDRDCFVATITAAANGVYRHGDRNGSAEGHANLVRRMNEYPVHVLRDAEAAFLFRQGLPVSFLNHYPDEVPA